MSASPTSTEPACGRADARWALACRGRTLDCRPGRAHVMGVLNVTPDSFSDGGRYAGVQAALDRAGEMWASGAAIIDVGGESTRPKGKTYGAGAAPVGLDEELERVVPVVEAIARTLPGVLISVDTYKGAVAREALRAGAHIVNDVTGLRHGVGTARAASDFGAALVVMHAVGRPGAHVHVRSSGEIVEDVRASLARSVAAAEAEGVQSVVVDAGFGFGKTAADNLRLVAETDAIRQRLRRPVLVGASRKSTIGEVLGRPGAPVPVERRAWGSVGLACLAAARGASIVRVHDVRETAEALALINAAEAARLEASGGVGASGERVRSEAPGAPEA